MKKSLITSLLILIFYQIGFTQSFDKAKLDLYFKTLEEHDKFMGSVAVSKDGEIIYTRSIGYDDVESKQKATAKTKYRVGSISKSFTTVLVLKAVEMNKLELDQTLDQWFPTIPKADKITIKQLLSHRSGIHNLTQNPDYLSWNTKPMTEAKIVEIIAKSGSDFEPDTQAEYSNSNFILLTYILEKTFKKPYDQILENRIVKPIGLKDTYVFGNIMPEENESRSYTYNGTWKEETETHFSIPLGAGAIASTPSDLTQFADALFGGQLLKPASLELMKTMIEGFGHGLFQIPFYDKLGYGHQGGIDGFSSVYAHFSEDNISFALTSNGQNIGINNVSIAVLSAVFDRDYEIPNFSTYKVSAEELDQYLGVYSSEQIELKITITKEGNTLFAQGTGQPAFPLEATDKDTFTYDQAGAKFTFDPSQNKMTLFQGGGQVNFTKQ